MLCVCVYIVYDKYGHHDVSMSRCLDIDSIPREPIKLLKSPSATRHVPDATRVRSMAHCATRERTRANESVAVASRRVVCSSCLRSCARTRWWGTTSATIGGDDDDDDDSIRFVRRRDDARARERWRTGGSDDRERVGTTPSVRRRRHPESFGRRRRGNSSSRWRRRFCVDLRRRHPEEGWEARAEREISPRARGWWTKVWTKWRTERPFAPRRKRFAWRETRTA